MTGHINLTLPTPRGVALTEDESTALLGQWVTVLFGGEIHMAQVQEVTALDWDHTRMEIQAKLGDPVEPDVAPVFARHSGMHINCEHDPAPRIGQDRTCTGDIGQEDTQDLGNGQA